ncbi:LuxR family transcriptional regulator [Streptomyces tateyamensis]|uniref:LuxR family transcriptional regulator n=1 Tax=Streptomyces tateyamensis TaxID=565073 RepID=A0A2V4PR79_9ACTN|nr:AAA family ATPase [Streptomyces tateyamensis]PYC87460.1 LuxR family transcriptional regulator [Streptomyces tateyamensis]
MRTPSPIVVGRATELALLDAALAATAVRRGGVVFLVGEPGIGKSRLAAECAHRAHGRDLAVLTGRSAVDGAGRPFGPLREALASRFRRTGPPTDPALLPYRPLLARLVPEWRTADTPVAVPGGELELGEALLRLLAQLGRPHGCLLVLEDLHDADPETVAVVEYLVDNLAELPVLLVATLRPDPGPAREMVRAAERRRCAAVAELRPLAPAEVRRLIAGCLDTPAGQVPEAVAEQLTADADGNPYLVEELLGALVGAGALRRSAHGWQVFGELGTVPTASLPASIVRSYGRRIAALDPRLRELLLVAACLGPRFAMDTVQLVTGFTERRMFDLLRAAAEASFLLPDPGAPGWYAFRHALTAEALLATLPPLERVVVARHAAAELERADPALPGERCRLAADLLLLAEDRPGAARHFAEAGRRALAAGAVASAVALLQRAHQLAAEPDRVVVGCALVEALAEAGRLDQALALAATVAQDADVDRLVAVHTRLAWAAVTAERTQEAASQAAAVRELLGDRATPEQRAALAVVEAELALLPGPGERSERLAESERLARLAVETAQRIPLPVVACQALQLLAVLARDRDFDEADAHLERMLAIAEQHDLPSWRVEALQRLGVNASMRTGTPELLEHARQAALRIGAVVLTQNTDAVLAMNAVLCAQWATARETADRALAATARLRNLTAHRYLLLTEATLAAHQGRRRGMEQALAAFDRSGGGDYYLVPLVLGLCRAFCALLEEDRVRATADLAAARAWEDEHPSVYHLTGRYGLHPLLAVLADTPRSAGAGADSSRAVIPDGPATVLAWNRQFLLLAQAAQLGRDGRTEAATRAVRAAQEVGEPFPTARHLGMRLIGEAALRDGWGEPLRWLRAAEEHFHAQGVGAVARACRTLLRQAGASVSQHRDGRNRIPSQLRSQGVTLREFEVFGLLPEAPTNQSIADRLAISPRTVEKHVASLLAKTASPDRATLCNLAAGLLAQDPPEPA